MRNSLRFVRLCLPVVLMLGVGASAAAQGLAAKAGVTFATVASDEDLGLTVSGQAGLLGGVSLTYWEDRRLSVQIDGQLALRRVAFGPNIEDRMTCVEVPVLGRYRLWRRESLVVRGLAGASLNAVLRATESVLGDDPFDNKSAFSTFELAVVVGAQAEWNERWIFDGRYYFGVTDTYSEVKGATQRGVQVSAAHRFR